MSEFLCYTQNKKINVNHCINQCQYVFKNDCSTVMAYQQGYADAIDDFARKIKPYIAEYRSAIEHNRYAFIDVNNIAEQLKEQEKE